MSPRSSEYFARAKQSIKSAKLLLDNGLNEDSITRSYYAMFEAVQGALSEHGRYAKTHSGAWALFHDIFIRHEIVDEKWATTAARAQRLREESDYRAGQIDNSVASEIYGKAREFVQIVEAMFIDT